MNEDETYGNQTEAIAPMAIRPHLDEQSLEQLYRTSFPKVYNFVFYRVLNREEAEDITSQTFIKAVKMFDKFDASKASFSTWVIAIARNTLIDYYRSRKVTVDLDDLGPREPSVEDEYLGLDDKRRRLARMLKELDEEDRELVCLKYFEGMKNVEIARTLGLNASTVATRLHRALRKMRSVEEGEL